MTDKYSLYFEWDVHNWSKAFPVWEEALKGKAYTTALELGSRNGGLSLWLAENYEMNIVCSDLESPEINARKLHNQYQTMGNISYKSINAMEISYPDNSFDVVVFKSVLGALSTLQNQGIAMHEIYRILKPGGVLLFAENLQSSLLHKTARRLFVRWGKRWRYMHLDEITDFMKVYRQSKIRTAGFAAILLPGKIKSIGLKIDDFLDRNDLLTRKKYIAFGYGIK